MRVVPLADGSLSSTARQTAKDDILQRTTRVPDQYGALYRLWQVYLHMRAWGSDDYAGLSAESREGFTDLVQTGSLFTYVEDCKRDVLKAGLDVPDEWLHPLCAKRLTLDGPLPAADRDFLGRILSKIYIQLVRLDPDAAARESVPRSQQSSSPEVREGATEVAHGDDPAFPPMQYVDPNGRTYEFGGRRLLWELFRELHRARRRLEPAELAERVPRWADTVPSAEAVKQALNELRSFWRGQKRRDIADRIKYRAGVIWLEKPTKPPPS